MAKKTVAKGKKRDIDRVKVIRAIKKEGGGYLFKEEMMQKEEALEAVKK